MLLGGGLKKKNSRWLEKGKNREKKVSWVRAELKLLRVRVMQSALF